MSDDICDISELLDPKFFRALCDPNRLGMMIQLLHGGVPRTVTQIAESGHVDISVVSRHLAMLRDVGILAAQRRGKEVYYSVRTVPLVQTLRKLADALEVCCPPAAVEGAEETAEPAAAAPGPLDATVRFSRAPGSGDEEHVDER